MPELPEVESVVRSLRPGLVGRRIRGVQTSGLPLRRPIDRPALAHACQNARVRAVSRVGKYVTIELSTDQVLLAHLGMSGRLLFAPHREALRPHTHAVLELDNRTDLRFVDPRRFGLLRVYAQATVGDAAELCRLGPDPLALDFSPAYLGRELGRSKQPLKAFLLDQQRIAGLGNIYVCEALFVAKLSPRLRAHRVAQARATKLHTAIQEVLRRAIENRGTSFSDYVDAEGQSGENQNTLLVYGRQGEPCRSCRHPILRCVQSGRSTFYCSHCQR